MIRRAVINKTAPVGRRMATLADPGGALGAYAPPDRSLGRAFSTSMPPPVQTYTSYAYNEELNKNGLESLPSNYFCDQSRFSNLNVVVIALFCLKVCCFLVLTTGKSCRFKFQPF